MSKLRLESKLRNVGIAYILLLFVGAHYAYVNKWGTQILFWITFGGLGIWWLIDLFRVPGLIDRFNDPIIDEIEYLEYREREQDDFSELRRMRAVRSGNLLEDRRRF
ncbi:TM2 domain-containing protein [Portibacter marinus]|uniref:TM2 domain-containing protein n=1 Tax=Portibacter marinus TaxID=2898660 RepID=UPI001F4543FF|nr:TM2 domain-containing protein [Portibacter marinus]